MSEVSMKSRIPQPPQSRNALVAATFFSALPQPETEHTHPAKRFNPFNFEPKRQVNGNAPFSTVFIASERHYSVFSAENGCGMSKFCTLSSNFCFSQKNARILRKVVVDTTDSLAEGVSCRQPTAVPLRQKIPPAKREQKKDGSQYFSAQKTRPPNTSKNKKEPAHSGTSSSFFSK